MIPRLFLFKINNITFALHMNNLDQIINLKVKVTTLLDQSITGTIYAYSPSNELLALRTGSGKNNVKPETFRFINTAFIKTIQVLPPFPKKNQNPHHKNSTNVERVPINEIEANLNDSIKNYKNSLLINNPKASPIAIKIFEKFFKLYGVDNVKWQGSDIILFDEIRLAKPYTLGKSGNIVKLDENSKAMNMVEDVLKEIWLEVDNEKRGG